MTRSRAPEFSSVLPAVAVLALIINDHVLKEAFHNALTGKISDFAGCFFLPLYVSAALAFITKWSWQRRITVGAALTVMIFVSVSSSTLAAHAVTSTLEFVTSWPMRIASDITDLIALPMVALAVLYARKVHTCDASSN